MPRSEGSKFLTDKYLQMLQLKETAAAATTLQRFDYQTGMSARGGWIWEVHFCEIDVAVDPAVIASAALGYQNCAISMMDALATFPTVGDYGTLYVRHVYRIGNGTQNLHYWSDPPNTQYVFPRPMLYAKPVIYLYYQQGTATAIGINARVGYVTKAASGKLLWETVEQFMSGV